MNPVKIAKLSLNQINRLLKGQGVRVKLGNHHVMNLHHEHAKKLHKSHMTGKGITLKLDPYSISKNFHLKGMGAVGEEMKQSAANSAIDLMDASTDRAIRGISAKGIVGKKLKMAAADNAVNLMTASVDRAIKGIKGNGRRRVMGMGAVGEEMKQSAANSAIDLMDASTDRAIRGISAKGIGKKLKMAAADNAVNLMTASVNRAIKGIKGGAMNPAGYGVSGVDKFKKYSSAVGDVLGLNSKAARDAKKQIFGALGNAGSTFITSQVPGSQYAPPAPTKQKRIKPEMTMPTMPTMPVPIDQEDVLPAPKISKATENYTPNDYGLPPLPDDNYYIPTGKLYASGMKRVLSQKQKDALARGREKLKAKRGGALYNAGYDKFNS